MAKARILYVIENESFGGGERAFAQLINGLDRDKYAIRAACLTGPDGSPSSAFTGAIARSAGVVGLDMRNLLNPLSVFRLAGILRREKIDLVHSQGPRADFYSRLASRLAGIKAVVSTVAVPVEEYNINPVKKAVYTALDRFSGRFTSKFIAVAAHLEEKLVRGRGIPADRVVNIYNGVEAPRPGAGPEAALSLRKKLGAGPDDTLVAAVGRLAWEKGLPDLIAAVKKMEESAGPLARGVKYLLVGEGELREELRRKIEAAGLSEKFIFTGFRNDVPHILRAIDILVLPSLREGFPMVILEAMAAGKPVIASDIDGVRESVSAGESGLLVPPGDPAAFAAALEKLVKDRQAAATMGRRGREIVTEKFGLERMVKEHEELYRELLSL